MTTRPAIVLPILALAASLALFSAGAPAADAGTAAPVAGDYCAKNPARCKLAVSRAQAATASRQLRPNKERDVVNTLPASVIPPKPPS